MKKTVAIISILIIFFSFINTQVMGHSATGVIEGADDFIQAGQSNEDVAFQSNELETMSKLINNILITIGIIIATIVGAIIGIQLIFGSVEQKAKTKEIIIPYIVGCVVIFGAFAIWRIVVTILQST